LVVEHTSARADRGGHSGDAAVAPAHDGNGVRTPSTAKVAEQVGRFVNLQHDRLFAILDAWYGNPLSDQPTASLTLLLLLVDGIQGGYVERLARGRLDLDGGSSRRCCCGGLMGVTSGVEVIVGAQAGEGRVPPEEVVEVDDEVLGVEVAAAASFLLLLLMFHFVQRVLVDLIVGQQLEDVSGRTDAVAAAAVAKLLLLLLKLLLLLQLSSCSCGCHGCLKGCVRQNQRRRVLNQDHILMGLVYSVLVKRRYVDFIRFHDVSYFSDIDVLILFLVISKNNTNVFGLLTQRSLAQNSMLLQFV